MSDFLPHPFWNFSLEIYSGEGVAEACLDLQERRGCDVNILLFCCWLGASGRPTLTADRLRALDPDALSPREALDALYALQRLAAE